MRHVNAYFDKIDMQFKINHRKSFSYNFEKISSSFVRIVLFMIVFNTFNFGAA